DAFRHVRLFARQIGTDDLPAISPIRGLENHVRSEVERVRIDRREHERRRAQEAIFSRAHCLRGDVLHLARRAVEARHFPSENDVRIERIGGNVAVLLNADGLPFAEGDLSVRSPTGDADGTALLLAAVRPVGKLVVRDDVIKLGRRLVVPTAPRFAAVDADRRPLIAGQQDNVRVFGIDPDGVIVVAAGRSLDGGERLAAIGRAIGRGVGDVYHVLVLRIDFYLGEVEAAAPNALLTVDALPAFAGIVGAVDAAQARRVHHRV